MPLGARFALRASVSYKGNWVRLIRTLGDSAAGTDAVAEQFAAAVAALPDARGFAGCSWWLVEGCRTAQPLEPLMGSRLTDGKTPAPGALVSVQAAFDGAGGTLVIGAPALIGAAGEASSLLIEPKF